MAQWQAMFEALTGFLRNSSEGYPLFWALAIVVVIAATGLFLFGFWQLVLRGVGTFASRSKNPRNN